MRTLAAFTAGAAIATLIATPEPQPQRQVEYQVEVYERTVYTDFTDIATNIQELEEQLYEECIAVIQRHTDDPKAGIIIHVERHYDGDACAAAEEAALGHW
jgi:hypothetical protein